MSSLNVQWPWESGNSALFTAPSSVAGRHVERPSRSGVHNDDRAIKLVQIDRSIAGDEAVSLRALKAAQHCEPEELDPLLDALMEHGRVERIAPVGESVYGAPDAFIFYRSLHRTGSARASWVASGRWHRSRQRQADHWPADLVNDLPAIPMGIRRFLVSICAMVTMAVMQGRLRP